MEDKNSSDSEIEINKENSSEDEIESEPITISEPVVLKNETKKRRREEKPKPNSIPKKEKQETKKEEPMEKKPKPQVLGKVVVTKFEKGIEFKPKKGYVSVFLDLNPEYPKIGVSCTSLHPTQLGPVNHGQPGLPIAKNLHNFEHGSTCLRSDAKRISTKDSDFEVFGGPLDSFNEKRSEIYSKEEAYYSPASIPKNAKIVHKFVWVNEKGQVLLLNSIQSRQIVCGFYQRLAQETNDFKMLKGLLEAGNNLEIFGEDVQNITNRTNTSKIALEVMYKNGGEPFGYERVLFTMLTHPPEDYPWIKFKTLDF